MKISPARVAAFDILIRIERDGAYSSALLAAHEAELSKLDRSLCHELTLGTIRRQILLDRLIEILTKGRKLDAEIRIALRLGLYQIRFLTRVPPHSAVNESVNLVMRARKASARAFVNGVLRSALRAMPVIVYADKLDRISVETSHPRWLIEKWAADRDLETAESVATANNERPAAAFRVVRRDERVDALVAVSRESTAVPGCFLLDRSEEPALALAEDGFIYFQDEASQMAAASVSIPGGGLFLDVCASPGGKTTQIANGQGARGGLLMGGDLHDSRVSLLRATCDRQDANAVKIVRYDAAAGLPFADGHFDAVLLDAPCSGTGTIRHNPELRYRVEPKDFARLASEQLLMLGNASKLLKRGGTLHYSTCSLEPEENEAVCQAFLEGDSSVGQINPGVPRRFHTSDGYARTWPDRDSTDGFFIAAFEKR
jgi:16S rRNA (cytosine967-C5)-methyltransferase